MGSILWYSYKSCDAHRAYGNQVAQSRQLEVTVTVRMASITLFVISTWLFAYGWYGDVILCKI